MTPMASVDFGVGTPYRKDKAKVAKKRVTIEARHRMAVERKREKVAMLTDLVNEWEAIIDDAEKNGTEIKHMTLDEAYNYLRELKLRKRTAEAQQAAMRP